MQTRMGQWIRAILMLAVFSGGTVPAIADQPAYLILVAPRATPHPAPAAGAAAGYGFGVEANGYAYGWFGAAPRRSSMSRHFGYYRNYTQWSTR